MALVPHPPSSGQTADKASSAPPLFFSFTRRSHVHGLVIFPVKGGRDDSDGGNNFNEQKLKMLRLPHHLTFQSTIKGRHDALLPQF